MIKKHILFITFIFSLFSVSLFSQDSSEKTWSKKGELWQTIPKAKWLFKIQNKVREDAVLTLQIIEDKDVNSKKKPVLTLEAKAKESKSLAAEINLPAISRIEVKRGKCHWIFTSGSLLREMPDFVFLSEHEDPACGQATGNINLGYNENTDNRELIFTLTGIEETQNLASD